MTCRSAALLHLAGACLAEGGGLPGGSCGLSGGSGSSGGGCLFVTSPEAGDEGDLLLMTRGRRARAGTGLGSGFRGRSDGSRQIINCRL